MKYLTVTSAALALLSLPVLAQDMFRAGADPQAVPASTLIGMRIYASEAVIDGTEFSGVQDGWQDIGEVNDILLSRDGTVDSVLVDIGGFLGMGERQVAVDMAAITYVSDTGTADAANDFFLVMNADRAVFEAAPVYGEMMTDTTTMADDTAPMTEGYVAFDIETLTADMLDNATVYARNGDAIGEISDLVIDDSGKISAVIVDVGGFLGIGEKATTLEMADLTIERQDGGNAVRVSVSLTEEQLRNMP